MKTTLLLIILAAAQITFACPNFGGKFNDEDGNLIEFTQTACSQIVMFSNNEETIFELDGVSRLHQKGATMNSFMSSKISGERLIIENVIKNKMETGNAFMHKMVMMYQFENPAKLIETTQLLDPSGRVQDTKQSTLLKQK